jgi:subtilase family serine protease
MDARAHEPLLSGRDRPTLRPEGVPAWLVAVLLGLCLLLAAGLAMPLAAGAASDAVALPGSSPLTRPPGPASPTPGAAHIEFEVGLQLRDPAGALALEHAVSDPASPEYRHFLTPGEWEQRFSPSPAAIRAVSAWLRSRGITVESVTPDRMTVQASAPAATVEHAFATGLRDYSRGGRPVRLSSGALRVPPQIASLISGVAGISEAPTTPNWLNDGARARAGRRQSAAGAAAQRVLSPAEVLPPPPGFLNAPPCSASWLKMRDAVDPPFGGGFPSPLPYVLCGYIPEQLQRAYGLSPAIGAGQDGSGVTVAIVDAYASPTLFSDAQEYSARNQPGAVLQSAQFEENLSPNFNRTEVCEHGNEWFVEQSLDVEAVHATAPGAKILYVGAQNCERGLYRAVQTVVDLHLAQVITDSWGLDGGDLIESPSSRRAFDNVLLMAAATGIGVQFSSGDEGDEFTKLGVSVAGYPASSPYATAVGGTSLEISKRGGRISELGWSTSKSTLCTATVEKHEELEAKEEGSAEPPECKSPQYGTWLPAAPGKYQYGSGGMTSYVYPEPAYQEGVVPAALSRRNRAFTGGTNRVEPDVAMDADPQTGMRVGLTQTFPKGTAYGEYRLGGTSLASPLFAGVIADADQAAGGSLGFVNPLLYKLAGTALPGSQVFYDVTPSRKQGVVRVDYADKTDEEEGLLTSVRTFTYEGPESFCDEEGCSEQNVSLSTARGFDSMTGIGTPGPGFIAALAGH